MTPYSDPHKHKRSEDQQEISLLIEFKSIINMLSTDHSNAHALWAHKQEDPGWNMTVKKFGESTNTNVIFFKV